MGNSAPSAAALPAGGVIRPEFRMDMADIGNLLDSDGNLQNELLVFAFVATLLATIPILLGNEFDVPTSVRVCGRYMKALPWICLPMLVAGISIFILSHHYPGAVPSPALLASLQTAGPVILGLTVLLLLVGIAGSCHVGTYLLERREAEADDKQYGGARPADEEDGGTRREGVEYDAAPGTVSEQLMANAR